MDVGIYYTDSTLSNWQPFDQGLPNVIVNELEIQYGAGKLRAATYGRGIWQSDLYSPSTLPPVASFSTTEGLLCPGDSIPFTDASLNASPGWTWYFPGGSPSNSTLQSPWVTYPTNGTYTASLVVQNANGTDSTSKTLQVSFGTTPVQVDILTDNYPTETSWSIYNAGSQFVAEGGGYGQANTLYSQLVCLDTGCYVFTISDSYGDGICCAYGTGSYQVERLDSNIVIADGGAFGSAESTSFCITAPASATDVSIFNEAALSIYPNPAEETLHVRWKSESFTWQISDLTGKILQTGQHEGGLNLDLRALPAGKYLIRLRADNDAVTATFVKMDN